MSKKKGRLEVVNEPKIEIEDGSCVRYDYGEGKVASEAPFARRVGGTGEDDGYVVTVVSDVRTLDSECWVFSARDIASGPIAKVELPVRVPLGFHAKWIAGERIFPA
jgi:carotenoid cleavage dioxygenase